MLVARPTIDEIKQRYTRYSAIRGETEGMEAKLADLKSNETFPAAHSGDGSKRTPGKGDRMERATIRRMEYEETNGPVIAANKKEMRYLVGLVNALSDPMQRMVMRARYLDVEGVEPLRWPDVAQTIYHDDGDAKQLACHRLHGKALKSLQSLMIEEKEGEE